MENKISFFINVFFSIPIVIFILMIIYIYKKESSPLYTSVRQVEWFYIDRSPMFKGHTDDLFIRVRDDVVKYVKKGYPFFDNFKITNLNDMEEIGLVTYEDLILYLAYSEESNVDHFIHYRAQHLSTITEMLKKQNISFH